MTRWHGYLRSGGRIIWRLVCATTSHLAPGLYAMGCGYVYVDESMLRARFPRHDRNALVHGWTDCRLTATEHQSWLALEKALKRDGSRSI